MWGKMARSDIEKNMRLVDTTKIVVGQSGLVQVVHFAPRFLSSWKRVLVSSKPNYTISHLLKMKVVNIEVKKGLIYPRESLLLNKGTQ